MRQFHRSFRRHFPAWQNLFPVIDKALGLGGERVRGYVITACGDSDGAYVRGASHVEMDTRDWRFNDDAEAARAAERDGVRLIYGIPFVEDGVYVDTPENRAVLERYSRKIAAAIRRRESANV